MPTLRAFLTSVATVLVLSTAAPATAQSDGPIPVVATFSILGDMVKRIGGKHVALTTLVGPDGDTHVYQPTPADARAVSEAKILVVNGLEFEGWLDRLVDASNFRGIRVVATDGIKPLASEHDDHDMHDDHEKHAKDDDHDKHDDEEKHAKHDDHDKHDDDEKHAKHDDHDKDDDHEKHAKHDDHDKDDDHEKHAKHDDHEGHDHGAFDPHAWQSLSDAAVYVDNITAALAKADPGNAGAFYRNREAYVAEIKTLDSKIRELVAKLPAKGRTVVTSHDAFQYFGRDYGLEFVAPQGLSTESEASAKDVARLIRQIRKQGIRAVFVENIGDPRLLKRIADETGAVVGGTLYPGALSGPDGPAPSYLDLMRHNATTLVKALGS